jgi:hypothetical protein
MTIQTSNDNLRSRNKRTDLDLYRSCRIRVHAFTEYTQLEAAAAEWTAVGHKKMNPHDEKSM